MYIEHNITSAVELDGVEMTEFVTHVTDTARDLGVTQTSINYETFLDDDEVDRLRATFYVLTGDDAEGHPE